MMGNLLSDEVRTEERNMWLMLQCRECNGEDIWQKQDLRKIKFTTILKEIIHFRFIIRKELENAEIVREVGWNSEYTV